MALKRLAVRAEVKAVDPAVAQELATEFAAWRLGGCPGYGFAEAFKAKVARTARDTGTSPSVLFTEIHRIAEPIYTATGK